MSKATWIEIEERLKLVFGRKPTEEEIIAEISAEDDAIYESLKDK